MIYQSPNVIIKKSICKATTSNSPLKRVQTTQKKIGPNKAIIANFDHA
jgi:hypothetical protein